MKKLKLEVDALQVETFGTSDHPFAHVGTVAGAAGRAWVGTDDTAKPDCAVSGSPTCGYTSCGDETCGTCDDNTWCGRSCILVCDAGDVVVTAAGD